MPLLALNSHSTSPWVMGGSNVPSQIEDSVRNGATGSSARKGKRTFSGGQYSVNDVESDHQERPRSQFLPAKVRRLDVNHNIIGNCLGTTPFYSGTARGNQGFPSLPVGGMAGRASDQRRRLENSDRLPMADASSLGRVTEHDRQSLLLSILPPAESDQAALDSLLLQGGSSQRVAGLGPSQPLGMSAVQGPAPPLQGEDFPVSSQLRRLRALRERGMPSTALGYTPMGYGALQSPLVPYDFGLQPAMDQTALGNVANRLQLAAQKAASEAALAAARLEGFQLASRMGQLGGPLGAQGLHGGLGTALLGSSGARIPRLAPVGFSQVVPSPTTSGGSLEPDRSRMQPMILAQPEDCRKLSGHQLLLRQQIEFFEATEEDTTTHTRGRNKRILLRQVGIRCRHCANLPVNRRQKGSTYFPANTLGIYQAAQNMSSTHMQCGLCSEMPESIKQEFARLLATKNISIGSGRPFWAKSAQKLGFYDTVDEGIRFAPVR